MFAMASSDGELRRDLEKFGVNVGPITATTRNIYIKRLEKLRKEQKSRVSPVSAKINKPAVSKSKRPISARDRSKSPVVRSGRTTRSSRSSNLGFSTDEDEDETVIKTPVSGAKPKNYTASKEFETRSLTPVHKRVKALANSRKSSSTSPKRRSASLPKPAERYSDDSDDASERSSTDSWVDMESAETNTTPSLARNQSRDTNERLRKFRAEIEAWKREEEKENSSVLSQRNLSSGRRSAVLRNVDQNIRNDNNRPVGNGIPSGLSKIVTQASQTKLGRTGLPDESEGDLGQKRPWTLNFSSFLPIGTCIFFVVLGLLYATMKYDPSLNSGRLINASSEASEGESMRIANLIYDYAATYAGDKECGTVTSEGRLKFSTLHEKIVKTENNELFAMACKQLIENPDWGVQFYDKEEVLINDAEKQQNAVYVDSSLPMLSGWCRFTRAVQKVLFRIILTTAVGILIWLGLVYRRYRLEKQREEREQMYTMVQKILDVLRREYEMSENYDNVQPFLPILHVRDMIIPPQDRKKMARVWERAKQFLSASETRIRVENQTIQGEDYLVWRWIQASSPAKRHTPTSRVWQGEAFDIKSGPMICPTPCLKIRNVFDPAMEVSKNWIEQIQDSILEKCTGNNEILRICVEKDSKEGLVYMLCATNQAAGRAFQALHGAWFDGRLITVKFIRLHRFHQRFPDSVNQSRAPMRPTSAVPVSTIISTPSTSVDTPQYEKLYPSLPDD